MSVRSRIAWFVAYYATVLTVAVSCGVLLFPSRDWTSAGPVAISPRWSVTLEERAMHPFLAEYYYRLRLFTGRPRDGQYWGTVDLRPNGGGRTWLCLYLLTAPNRGPLLEVDDRMEISVVDLAARRLMPAIPEGYERVFVGEFVEESYPLRFVPSRIEPACPRNR